MVRNLSLIKRYKYGKRKEAQNTPLSCLTSAKGLAPYLLFSCSMEAICRVMYTLLSTFLVLPASQGVEGVDCTNKQVNKIVTMIVS